MKKRLLTRAILASLTTSFVLFSQAYGDATQGEKFPQACQNLKAGGPILLMKGVVSKPFRETQWIFFALVGEDDARFPIADTVGWMGSSDGKAPVVLKNTPAGYEVHALVDTSANGGRGLVRCLSTPIKVGIR